MTGKDKDQALQEYLNGDSPITRAYASRKQQQPPPAVDNAVLSAARKAAGSGSRSSVSPFGGHWRVPASLAAVLVLAVGLVLFIDNETGIAPSAPESRMAPSMPGVREEETAEPGSPDARTPKKKSSKPDAGDDQGKAGIRRQRTDSAREIQTPTLQSAPRAEKGRPPAPAAAGVADGVEPTPERWLTQIKELKKQGRQDEAKKLLEQFRKRFPDYPLAENLNPEK